MQHASTSGEGPDLVSIGELATATGVSPDTIRVWERRYGRPSPVRLTSGHRRYGPGEQRWLRRISEALALGHRPSRVVHLSEAELDRLLYPQVHRLDQTSKLRKIIDLVRNYEGDRIAAELRRSIDALGPHRFIEQTLGPLLGMVGRMWADGELEIRHEHYLTELLEDLVRSMRKKIAAPPSAKTVVLATLSGETHRLGMQIAAVMCALAGVRPQVLGVDTPVEEIVAAAREMDAAGVALSVTLATGGVQTDRAIRELRRQLPSHMRLAVGGQGARQSRRGPRGVDYVSDRGSLETWLDNLA